MAIDIDPTPARRVVASEETFTANAIWGDSIIIDASARDFGKIATTVTVTPYQRDDAGNALAFASDSVVFKTANVVAACARVPEMGIAFAAIQAGIAAWHRYTKARAADLMGSQSALTTATAAEAAAKAALDAAVIARNAAFADRNQRGAGPDDPAWVSADEAWQQATAAYTDAQATARAASATVTQAQAAFDDAANPPIG